MSPQYGELRPTNGWHRFGCLGHPSKFQRVSHLAFVTAAALLTGGQLNFARCLVVFWAGTLYMYIYFPGLSPADGILPGTKFTLCPSLVFSYIVSITARHSSSGHQPNFVAWYKEWNYGTFAEGATCIWMGDHHIGHWPHSSYDCSAALPNLHRPQVAQCCPWFSHSLNRDGVV